LRRSAHRLFIISDRRRRPAAVSLCFRGLPIRARRVVEADAGRVCFPSKASIAAVRRSRSALSSCRMRWRSMRYLSETGRQSSIPVPSPVIRSVAVFDKDDTAFPGSGGRWAGDPKSAPANCLGRLLDIFLRTGSWEAILAQICLYRPAMPWENTISSPKTI